MPQVVWTSQLPYLLLTGGGLVWGGITLSQHKIPFKTRVRKFAQIQSFMSGAVPLMLMGTQHILQPETTRSAMSTIHNLDPNCSRNVVRLQKLHGTVSLSLGIIVLVMFLVAVLRSDTQTANTMSTVSIVVAAIMTALGVTSLRSEAQPKNADERMANKMHQVWAFTSAAILTGSSVTQLAIAH